MDRDKTSISFDKETKEKLRILADHDRRAMSHQLEWYVLRDWEQRKNELELDEREAQ